MTDAITQKPLRVLNEGTAGPYIEVLVSQLNEIRWLLDNRGIHYWVGEHAFSFDGGPEAIEINFGRRGDAAAIQAILDGVRGAEVSHGPGQ